MSKTFRDQYYDGLDRKRNKSKVDVNHKQKRQNIKSTLRNIDLDNLEDLDDDDEDLSDEV